MLYDPVQVEVIKSPLIMSLTYFLTSFVVEKGKKTEGKEGKGEEETDKEDMRKQ